MTQNNTTHSQVCLTLETKMKIKMEVEIDTENNQDLNTIKELIEMLKALAENYYIEE